jgi:hypothetical protein
MLIISLAMFQGRHKAKDRADAQEGCTSDKALVYLEPSAQLYHLLRTPDQVSSETIFYEAGVKDRNSACRCACRSRPRRKADER